MDQHLQTPNAPPKMKHTTKVTPIENTNQPKFHSAAHVVGTCVMVGTGVGAVGSSIVQQSASIPLSEAPWEAPPAEAATTRTEHRRAASAKQGGDSVYESWRNLSFRYIGGGI